MPINPSLGQRIGLAFLILLSLAVTSGGIGLTLLADLRTTVDEMLISVEHLNLAEELAVTWSEIGRQADEALRQQRLDAAPQLSQDLDRFRELIALLSEEESKVEASRSDAHFETNALLVQSALELAESGEALRLALSDGRWREAQLLRTDQVSSLESTFILHTGSFRRDEQNEVVDAMNASVEAEARVTYFWRVAAVVLVLTAILSGLAITRSTLAPIRTLIEQARRVATRDFSPIDVSARRDEIGELSRAFGQMTDWLSESYRLLEQRVAESTHELEMAAEVSLTISRMQDVQSLLDDAVELIRQRFDLYHVQVYLADESGLSLTLHAGSGLAGQELTQLGQQLAIGPGSICGLAAMRQTAVIVTNTADSDIFRPNPVLPYSRAELAVPLVGGNTIVGVLSLCSSQVNGLTEDRLPAFSAIAGQLAIAISNARLFTEVETARRQLAGQAEQTTHEGWREFLNGIERSEHVVAIYDGQSTRMVDDVPAIQEQDDCLQSEIAISGEAIGRICVIPRAEQTLPAMSTELMSAVTDQVARRVESIRLLEQANRFRHEAEASSRRLTHDAWVSYLHAQDASATGYAFEKHAVRHMNLDERPPEDALVTQLRVRNQTIGALAASGLAPEESPFAQELLAGVAERLAGHLENLRLAHETERALAVSQRRNQELALVNQVVASATSSLDLRQNLTRIAAALVGALKIGHAGIALLDEEGTQLTVVADASSVPDEPSAVGTVFPLAGNALTQQVLQTRQPVVVSHAQQNPGLESAHEAMRRRRTVTLVLCPVIAANEVIGTLGLDILDADRTLSPDEIQLVDTVMRQAATAIQQSRLFQHLQATLARTEALYAGSSLIIQARTPEHVLSAVVESTMLHDLDHVNILLFDQAWSEQPPEQMTIVASWPPIPAKASETSARKVLRLDRLPTLRQMVPGKPQIFRDLVDSRPEASDLQLLLATPGETRGLALFPVVVRGQWLGILTAQSAKPLAINEHDVRQIGNLTGQGATVIENLRLFEQTESALAETAILFHISGALNAATSLNEMLRAVATAAIRPGVEVVELLLSETDRQGRTMWVRPAATWFADERSAGPAFAGPARLAAECVPGLALFQNDPYSALLIDDALHDDRLDESQRLRYEQARVRATAILPLRQGQNWLGYLVISWARPCEFSSREWRLYSGFANQAAITLANLRLLSQTQAQARRERILREVTERVRTASDVDTIMRIAAQEIGQALGRPTVVSLEDGHSVAEEIATEGMEPHA